MASDGVVWYEMVKYGNQWKGMAWLDVYNMVRHVLCGKR